MSRALAALLLAAVAASGCFGRAPRPEAPAAETPDEAPAPAAVLARLADRADELRSLRAIADVEVRDAAQTIRGRQIVIVERPGRIRFDVLSTFGVILQVASDGERIRAFDRRDGRFYAGRASSTNLARFTRLDLDLSAVSALLLGIPPAERRRAEAAIDYEPETALWRVTSPLEGGEVEHLWVEPGSLVAVRSEVLSPRGLRRYDARFGDHREVDGVIVPHRVSLTAPASDTSITLTYSDIDVNPTLREGLFAFEPPRGVEVVDLDG